ncbi:hypothetical protein KSP40_PGU008470 [Platanthera guangdongensis]|uniref:Uncharacterized protein n=1 Tax=Platanthera guangdongensis TaxID=2320717 RepID=A0ABR2N095_9ASPA
MRCFGKGITQTALKRKEDIAAWKKVHNEEVALLNEKVQNVEDTLNTLKSVLNIMLQQSKPIGIDVQSLENLLGSSSGDANSGQKRDGLPHAHSSTSTHVPNYGEKVLDDSREDK